MEKINWQTEKLDDVCDVEYGTRVVNKRDGGSTYPVYGGGGATFFMDKYNREDCMVVARFAMSEKCTRFVSGKFFLNDSGLTVLPKNNKEISQEFLDYQLISLNDHIYSLARGSAQKNLDLPAFRKLKISYPESLPEQHRLVKILDEVFEKVAKAKENSEKNLQNAKQLFESYLQSVFTKAGKNWEEKNLGELCEVITKGTTPTSMGYKFVEEGINFIKIESITPSGKFLPNKFAAITEECHKAFKRSQLKRGDILFSIAGALGRTAFVDEDILPANTNQALAIVRLKLANNVLPKFVLLSLNSGLTSGQIGKLKGGVAQQNLSLEQLKNFQISLPLLAEQKSIVKKLDALSAETKKLEAIYKQKLADLEELKKSVLRKAFAGEL